MVFTGFSLGFGSGFVTSYVASVAGSVVCFYVCRKYFVQVIREYIKKHHLLDALNGSSFLKQHELKV